MHHTLADYLLDLVQNSIEAKSSLIIVDFLEKADEFKLYVADNGTGMDEEQLRKAKNPFYTEKAKHEHRKVGLGISFLAQLASQCDGSFDISSEKGTGTSLLFSCPRNHPDLPPVGNLSSAVLCLFSMKGEFELRLHRESAGGSYTVLRSEVMGSADDFEDGQVLVAVRKYLQSLEEGLL
ncbi:Histidine kinase [Chitinispirillum alkaliphilum]|nr:Histidine kinase [Chitinispirillum alkaliphilum]